MTTITKSDAPRGDSGQLYLMKGDRVALRMWDAEAPTDGKEPHVSDYETLGYAISGRAVLHMGGKAHALEPGTSWVVPEGATHHYEILEAFTAVEATSPPARDS